MEKAVIHTPIGFLTVQEEGGYITAIKYAGQQAECVRPATPLLRRACSQLEDYFDGRLKEFSFKMKITGTPFRKKVLEELMKVGYGQTVTYKQLARAVGNPNAARAVGSAMRTNPLVIAVPCHRVLPQGGKLGNYSAGGPANKEWLLAFEKQNSTPDALISLLSALG